MKRTKYHIYTIAPGKKFTHTFICLAGAFIVFVLSAICFNPSKKEFRDYILKKSADSCFLADSVNSGAEFSVSEIRLHTLMQEISPVFSHTEKSALIYGNEPATPEDVYAKETQSAATISKTYIPQFKNETPYPIDAVSLLNTPATYNASGSKVKVLIIHTHGCETYSGQYGGIGDNGTYRTTDTSINMVAIGNIIEEVLKENNIGVIHDTTLCDYPTYNTSYVKSLSVIEEYLQKYPEIEFVFDIHRDAIAKEDGTPVKTLCRINNEDSAQAMIVCGTDALGLENPNWQKNLILALKIQKNLDIAYPGLMRPLNIRKERFNMHKTNGSLLFEVGSHTNTLEEAKRSARYLAQGIAKTIK